MRLNLCLASALLSLSNPTFARVAKSQFPAWLDKILAENHAGVQHNSLDKRQQPGAYCVQDGVLTDFQNIPSATPFCSSYISVPASTSTMMINPIITTTVVSTNNRYHTLTITSTTTVKETATAVDIAAKLKKRGPIPTAALALNARQAMNATSSSPNIDQLLASTVSSACSCISIPVTVVTSTETGVPEFQTVNAILYGDPTIAVSDILTVTSTTTTTETLHTAAPSSSVMASMVSSVIASSINMTRPASTSTPEALCPTKNGTDYVVNSHTYTIACGIDYPQTDLSNTSAASLMECIGDCETYNAGSHVANCDGVTYRTDTGVCYIKTFSSGYPMGIVENYPTDSAVRRYTVNTVYSSASATVMATVESTVNSTVFVTAYSTVYANASSSPSGSLTVSATSMSSATSTSAASSTSSAGPPSSTAIMPTVNCSNPSTNGTTTTVISAGNRYDFLVLCNKYITGADDTGFYSENDSTCRASCVNADNGYSMPPCKGASFNEAAMNGTNNCYLKIGQYASEDRAGFTSFVLLAKSTTGYSNSTATMTTNGNTTAAIYSVMMDASPAVTTPPNPNSGNSTGAFSTSTSWSNSWYSTYGSSWSTQWSTSTSSSSSSSETIIIIGSTSGSSSGSDGGSSGYNNGTLSGGSSGAGGYYGNSTSSAIAGSMTGMSNGTISNGTAGGNAGSNGGAAGGSSGGSGGYGYNSTNGTSTPMAQSTSPPSYTGGNRTGLESLSTPIGSSARPTAPGYNITSAVNSLVSAGSSTTMMGTGLYPMPTNSSAISFGNGGRSGTLSPSATPYPITNSTSTTYPYASLPPTYPPFPTTSSNLSITDGGRSGSATPSSTFTPLNFTSAPYYQPPTGTGYNPSLGFGGRNGSYSWSPTGMPSNRTHHMTGTGTGYLPTMTSPVNVTNDTSMYNPSFGNGGRSGTATPSTMTAAPQSTCPTMTTTATTTIYMTISASSCECPTTAFPPTYGGGAGPVVTSSTTPTATYVTTPVMRKIRRILERA